MSEWTVDTLKEHVDMRFEEKEKALVAALAASDRKTAADLNAAEKAVITALNSAKEAVTKAEESQLRVNIGQNEFRGALKDQAVTLMPRAEADAKFKGLEDKIAVLNEAKSAQAGRSSGIGGTWGVIATVAGILIAIGGILVAVLL